MREGGGQHERHRQPEHGVPRQRHHVVPSQPRREHDTSGVRGVLFYPFYPPTSAPLTQICSWKVARGLAVRAVMLSHWIRTVFWLVVPVVYAESGLIE